MPIVKYTHLNQTILARFYPVQGSQHTVVILTGMEEHSLRYEPFAQYLNLHQFSVYVFDHLGQGLNAPEVKDLGRWPVGTFEWTVDALGHFMTHQLTGQHVHFIGHSLGSFIGQRLIQTYHHVLHHVVLIGTNHQDPMAPIGRWLTQLLTNKHNRNHKAPFFNQLAFGKYAAAIKPRKTAFDWLSVNDSNVQSYIEDPYCGYVSTFGFWKELLHGLHHLFDGQRLSGVRKNLPIFIVAGSQDPVGNFGKGPKKVADMYLAHQFSQVKIKLYAGLRHEILHEDEPRPIYDDIVRFLQTSFVQ
jgi:alpha-beta hydrolase superfamily lysophospholipase